MVSPIDDDDADGHWRPPSNRLSLEGGLWRSSGNTPVSYPSDGNCLFSEVEESSFWFKHRLDCIQTVLRRYPASGAIYDLGGGNGYVASAIQSAGIDVVLVEPGSGAQFARDRGVRKVIKSTVEDAAFDPGTLAAVAVFDVLEHIGDDVGFLKEIARSLKAHGRLYCTVPAYPFLWSDEDVHTGHYRRYTRRRLVRDLSLAGFQVDFITSFFIWLTVPLFVFRALPSRFNLKHNYRPRNVAEVKAEHKMPALLTPLMSAIDAWEIRQLAKAKTVPFGASILCVAHVE